MATGTTARRRRTRDFARWLDTTLANEGLTGKELAALADLDEAQISRWRRGRGLPSMESVERLSLALRVDAVRLAVTVGLMSEKMAGVPPLPTPPPTALFERVRDKLRELPQATDSSVERMLEEFKRGVEESE